MSSFFFKQGLGSVDNLDFDVPRRVRGIQLDLSECNLSEYQAKSAGFREQVAERKLLWMNCQQTLLTVVLGAVLLNPLFAIEVTGAGASFPAPLYMKWAASYEKLSQDRINYQSIGSGGGIKQIEAKIVDFGASDMPLKSDELKQYGLVQFPTVIGGVIPIINLDGIAAGKIKLSAEVLANIFLGNINQWNDARIQKLNPDLTLPNNPITVVHRADGSGTTFLFTRYLSEVNNDWNQKLGANSTINWPVGVGGKGNEGVSSYVQHIKGAIGYVEYAYAFQNKLPYALLQNKDGAFVAPSASAFKEAAAKADWKGTANFGVLLINQTGKGSWPISGATFILMHRDQSKLEQGKATLAFFDWAYKNGGEMAESLYYVPLPKSVTKLVEDNWKQTIKDNHQKPIWP